MGTRRIIWLVTTVAVILASAACGGADTSTTGRAVPLTGTPPSVSVTPTPPTPTQPTATPPTRAPTTAPPDGTTPDDASDDPAGPDSGNAGDSEMPAAPAGGGDALDALAPFFAAVAQTDQNLRAAAEAVNAGIVGDTVTFDQTTIDAVDRGAPDGVAATIPTGLDPAVEQAVLLVYSDLVSRYGSMRGGDCVYVSTRPRAELNADCFVRGHEASLRTSDDVDAAYAAAAATPVTVVPDPDSRESAEVPLRIEYINKANMGCGTMGGYLAVQTIPIDWVTEDSGAPEIPPTDGHVGGVGFTASYDSGNGWTVDLRAC
jgi:hypothetical protein